MKAAEHQIKLTISNQILASGLLNLPKQPTVYYPCYSWTKGYSDETAV